MPNVRIKRNKHDLFIEPKEGFYQIIPRTWKGAMFLFNRMQLPVGGKIVALREQDVDDMIDLLSNQGLVVKHLKK